MSADDRPAGAEPAPETVAATTVDRRGFVRVLAGESISTAGRLAGMSGMVAGSLVAAAKAAGESFSALGAPAGTTLPPPSAAPRRALPPRSAADVAPAAPLRLSEADRSVLDGLTIGVLATNQPGAAPATGVVRFVFDGEAFRIPGRSATARTANLQRDPFASITLIDPASGDALLLAGRARIVYGDDGRQGAADAFAGCGVDLPDGWERADGRGDPILIVLEPARLIRRHATDERP